MIKIGDSVKIWNSRYMLDCDGIIISETLKYWKVRCFNHKTLGELWDDQKDIERLFNKNNFKEKIDKYTEMRKC